MIATMSQLMGCRLARNNRAPRASLTVRLRRLLRRGTLLGLVYEHNRNAIADRIAPTARITDKAIFFQPNWGLASGARKDVEQFLIDHPTPPAHSMRRAWLF